MAITTTNSKYGSQPLAHQDYYLEHVAGNGVHSQTELKASKTLVIQARPGEKYRVISEQGEIPDNLVAIRTNNDLEVRFDNGVNLIIEDYYLVCSNNYCGIRLSDDGVPLSANDDENKPFSGESTIVYSQGNIEGIVLLDLVATGLVLETQDNQTPLESSILTDTDEDEGIDIGMVSLGVAGLSLVAATVVGSSTADSVVISGGDNGDGDTTAPTTTIMINSISNDTGSSSEDFLTNYLGGQTISATLSKALAEDEILEYSNDGGVSFTDITNSSVNGTAITHVDSQLTSTNTIQFRVTDTAGNSGTTASQLLIIQSIDAIELSEVQLDSNDLGFVLNGVSEGDKSGWDVNNAGDVNGDGFDDVIIGARYADGDAGDNSGASYVVFGKTDGSAIELADIESGDGGFVINGVNEGDLAGWDVSSAGDVNGDGLDDLIIGARGVDTNGDNSGASYVVFGKNDGDAIELANLERAGDGFVINGVSSSDESGKSVSSAGDVNGDGLDDLIIGATGVLGDTIGSNNTGAAYVVFGKTDVSAIELADIESGDGGFVINGVSEGDLTGWDVSSAGDINGDGLDDLIVGAWGVDAGNYDHSGASYVVFGKTDGDAIESADLEASEGFVIYGVSEDGLSGIVIKSAGDVNGDGLDDMIIGAYGYDTIASYVVFGKTDGDDIELADVKLGIGGFMINGADDDGRSGRAVSNAGDINGDGFDDLIVGIAWIDPDREKSSVSYVIYGKADIDIINLGDVELGIGGFVISGVYDDPFGLDVSSAGDVNGDGFDDMIVGVPRADGVDSDNNTTIDSGVSYVVFGGQGTRATVGSSGDDLIEGDASADQIVAGQGDDELVGNGGADVLRGGEGKDILAISDDTFFSLDGGNGTDTLRFDAAMTLDFTQLSDNKITSIEQIDLLNDGGNSNITLDLTDVLQLGEGSTDNPLIDLVIIGDSNDTVTLDNNSNGQEGTWDQIGNSEIYRFISNDSDILATVQADNVSVAII